MNLPVKQQVLSEILREMDIADISRTTIRQGVAVANALEKASGEKFVHLEIGVPRWVVTAHRSTTPFPWRA